MRLVTRATLIGLSVQGQGRGPHATQPSTSARMMQLQKLCEYRQRRYLNLDRTKAVQGRNTVFWESGLV